MTQTPFVSVTIVNYNGAQFLPRVLTALTVQTFPDFEIIFVDNNSQDDSLSLVQTYRKRHHPPLRIIANGTNVGFAPACNQALHSARGEWVAFLNNDAWPEPTWLERLLAPADLAGGVGMVAAKMLFADDPAHINSAGIALDRVGIAWDWRGGEIDTSDETQVVEVFGPCGGAGLYARTLLDTLGGFDDDFFAYLEDADLAWRARLAGWKSVLAPQARVYHIHSATLGNASPFKNYLLGRNKIWSIVKNYPSPWFIQYLPIIIAYDIMAVLYGAMQTHNAAALNGRLAGLRKLPVVFAKRRRIQKKWLDGDNCIRVMKPVLPPWQISRRYSHLY